LNHTRGLLIDLEGIDGAGKTTVVEGLGQYLEPERFRVVHHKHLDEDGSAEVRRLHELIWPRSENALAELPSRSRVLLHAAWLVLLSEQVIAPLLAAGQIVVVDGWLHKMMARLAVDGYPEPYLRQIFAGVLQPSLVVLLDPGAELVWTRAAECGRRFGAVEMGKYGGYSELGRASFIDYQTRFVNRLRSLLDESGIPVFELREDLSVDATRKLVAAAIRERAAN